ncbi:multiple inositol polyphosphate phosphatase 1-like isoform X2 [Lycorma delicatula]|uniref:multiple inositol polyphosphate phosphatase 1-like isoform X2 n=1 Tax=Lycorma delicatula TaxID=130591 RepID=UPI003F50D96A
MLLFSFVFSFIFIDAQHEEGYCLAKDPEPYLRFSSKTAYEFVYGKEKYEPIPHCKPRQVWVLARHGTRNPSRPETRNLQSLVYVRDMIIRNHEERHSGHLCKEDIENFKTWQYNLTEDEHQNLTIQGWNEHKFLALRLKSKFKEILDMPYSPEKFTITTTDTTRTRLSAKAFVEGMFGPDSNIEILPANNTIIKVYKGCPVWIEEVDTSPEAFKEVTLFKETSLMKEATANISRRLGFAYNLTFMDLHNMYMMCAYSKSWDYYKTSPWCAAFTKDELKLMEYVRDLWYYYKSGYGMDINLKVGCPAVRDIMERFTRLANNDESEPNGVFYFTHTTAVNSALSRLGIAKDPYMIRHDNYFNVSKRLWQTSLIGPFMSNLQAIFYKCTEGEENRVMFFLNEHIVNYEGCDVGLCSFKYLKEKLASIVDPSTCNNKFCFKSSANQLSNHSFILSVISLLIILKTVYRFI